MLITIHNLPMDLKYKDLKSLILSKCGVRDIILDSFVAEGIGKKVTVGVADEGDAAMIVRNMNSIYLKDLQLVVEVVRQRQAEDQPYFCSAAKNTPKVQGNQYQNMESQNMYQDYSLSQMVQAPVQQDILTQTTPLPVRMKNYTTTMAYQTPQTGHVGITMQQYPNNSAPSAMNNQNINNFRFQNYQNTALNWRRGNFNPGQNFVNYLNNSQPYYEQTSQSQYNNNTTNNEQGYKRKRSNSPNQVGWSNNDQSTSRMDYSGKTGEIRSWPYDQYGSYVLNTPKNNDLNNQSRWNVPPSSSFKIDYSQTPKSKPDPTEGRKKFKPNDNDSYSSTPNNSNKTTQQNHKKTIKIPTISSLRGDKNIRCKAAKDLAKNMMAKFVKRYEDVPSKIINRALLLACNARTTILTNHLCGVNLYQVLRIYRRKFPESDDEHFFKVVINRCKRERRSKALRNAIHNKPSTSKPVEEMISKIPAGGSVSQDPQTKPTAKCNEGSAESNINATMSQTPQNNNAKTKVSRPKNPKNKDKNTLKENKKEVRRLHQQGPSAVQGDPMIKRAVEMEIGEIDKLLLQIFEESKKQASPTEAKFFELYKKYDVASKINQTLQLNILRRLCNTNTKPILRINGRPKLPNKTDLMNFLEGYGVVHLKKSDRSKFFVATCRNYTCFDKLCAMQNAVIGSNTMSFSPMHVGGPPDKKLMRSMATQLGKDIKNKKLQVTQATDVEKNQKVEANNENVEENQNIEENQNVEVNKENVEVKNENVEKKEQKDLIKQENVMNRSELDWPNVAEEDVSEWLDNTDIKDVKDEHEPNDENIDSGNSEIKNGDTNIVKKENVGDNEGNVADNEGNDAGNDGSVAENEGNDDNERNVGYKEGNVCDNEENVGNKEENFVDTDDINMDDLDDDDLEDY